MRGLSLVAVSGGHSSSQCAGFSLSRPLLLRSTSSRRAGSVVVAHGPSCSAACGIFPDQGSNSCPPHWQADSQPLRHQGSPKCYCFKQLSSKIICYIAVDNEYTWEPTLDPMNGIWSESVLKRDLLAEEHLDWWVKPPRRGMNSGRTRY